MFRLFRAIFRLLLGMRVCVGVYIYIFIYCSVVKGGISFTLIYKLSIRRR